MHTPKFYINVAVNKLISTKNLPKPTPLMCRVLRWMAKWKAVIVVCLLRIIIRTNLVDPESNRFFAAILDKKGNIYIYVVSKDT